MIENDRTLATTELSHPLDNCCFTLSDTHAKCGQAIIWQFLLLGAPFHFMQQRGQDASSGASQRMAERNSPPVDIDPSSITARDWMAKASFNSIK